MQRVRVASCLFRLDRAEMSAEGEGCCCLFRLDRAEMSAEGEGC